MLYCALPRDTEKPGAVLIGVGLAIVVVAQWKAGVPIAAAIALVGWGAQLTLISSQRSSLLGLVNLPVYAILVSLAVAAQVHANLHTNVGKVPLTLAIDHALAILLLVSLTFQTTRHLISETE